ncbi:MAG: hypothetical protein EB079_06865 [Verrucomicrobia bacterium]|nr:hypothetical protein [Verrucomicrobiota bacterium]
MAAADYAIAGGFDVLGAIAGNGKMLPAEMHRVLDPVVNGSADYVTGSRYLPGGSSPNLTRFRGLAIPAVTLAVRLLTGRRITDATCGYRCYRLDILKRATFDWHAPWLEGYGFEYYLYAHEGAFQHISNANTSARNQGVNAYGGFVGFTYVFDKIWND